jgi:hypothetical protein
MNNAEKSRANINNGHSIPYWSATLIERFAGKILSFADRFLLKDDEEVDKTQQLVNQSRYRLIKERALGLAEDATIKVAGERFLKQHNLPRYNKVKWPLIEFLENSQERLDNFVSPTGLYFPEFINLKTEHRIYALSQTRDEVEKFILQMLEDEQCTPEDYLFVLSEFWPNDYGGSVIINKAGDVSIELMKGSHTPLTTGRGKILLTAKSDCYTKLLKFIEYQEIDPDLQTELRQTINKILALIPKKSVLVSKQVTGRFQEVIDNGDGPSVKLPYAGYFEFILSRLKTDSTLRPFFIDARVGKAGDKYYSVNKNLSEENNLSQMAR